MRLLWKSKRGIDNGGCTTIYMCIEFRMYNHSIQTFFGKIWYTEEVLKLIEKVKGHFFCLDCWLSLKKKLWKFIMWFSRITSFCKTFHKNHEFYWNFLHFWNCKINGSKLFFLKIWSCSVSDWLNYTRFYQVHST